MSGQRTAGLSLQEIHRECLKVKESIRQTFHETEWDSPYAQPLLLDYKNVSVDIK